MRTIVAVSYKVGLGTALKPARRHQRDLMIDFDPQQLTTSPIFENIDFERPFYDLLFWPVAASVIIQSSSGFSIDVAPFSNRFSSIDPVPTLRFLPVCTLVVVDELLNRIFAVGGNTVVRRDRGERAVA